MKIDVQARILDTGLKKKKKKSSANEFYETRVSFERCVNTDNVMPELQHLSFSLSLK